MLSVVADERARAVLRGDLDELAREGARRMLAAALEAEVDDYLAAYAAERDEAGRRLVVRNGHAREREVTTVAGAIPVRAPRVDDRRTDPSTGGRARFRSVILPPWCRRSPKVAEVLPLLYLHGLSTGDFVPALEQFFGSSAGLSAAAVGRLLLRGRPTTSRSASATWPTGTTCTSGPTACTSGCGWSRLACAVW
jgi:putative transposase